MDFYKTLDERVTNRNASSDYVVWPDFKYAGAKDIVVKGGDFYAYWNGETWITDIDSLIKAIDQDSWERFNELRALDPNLRINVKQMDFASSGIMAKFQQYCQLRKPSDIQFNKKILFSNYTPKKTDYSTYQLSYTPTEMETPAFDELMSVLYADEELEKILWALGALLCGKMNKIEKFLYLYGAKGTGKGTAINIIKKMFEQYWGPIDLRTLTGSSEFATSAVTEVPMLIDADSDISRIRNEQNLLKLTSHEELMRNVKFKSPYPVVFDGLLITASNERYTVKNKDSGITRRAIVVNPTGKTVPYDIYQRLYKQIDYEIPGIAYRAMQVFKKRGASYYENLVDTEMVEYSDKVFAFIRESSFNYIGKEYVKLADVVPAYQRYLTDMGWDNKGAKRELKNELHKYFETYVKDTKDEEGKRIYDVYKGFRMDVAFPEEINNKEVELPTLEINIEGPGAFDKEAAKYPAQYANEAGYPIKKWDDVLETLDTLDPTKLHYVRVPQNHIVLDFDLKDPATGEKSFEMNLAKASSYPPTYAELSKSGGGIHLHYIYDGDVSKLAPIIEDDIEIKVYSGKSSLRRKLSLRNDLPIAHISTGLPFKEEKETLYKDIENIVWTETKLRAFIEAAMNKEHHGATKPEIDFINAKLNEAKDTGVQYDLSSMRMAVLKFAMTSSNQAEYCIKLVSQMPFSTIETEEELNQSEMIVDDKDITFYDIEVFPNLLLICWKKYGQPGVIWYNPTPEKIKELMKHNLVGFNNRKYDNHIIYNRMLGASNLDMYHQSQQIINNQMSAMMQPAYGISYADLYEMMDIKQSLKKWEIELGIKHDELEFPWDQPLPEDEWARCAEYCMNDVIATEELFKSSAGQDAYTARKILCELTDMPINFKTQTLAEKFLFGDDPRPQDKFVWYDLAKEFPGYKYSYGKSDYLGEDPSEGGYVYSEPGVYKDVWLLDVESLHPHSLIALNYFGPYTPKFAALVKCRMHIKHKEFDLAAHAFDEIDPELSRKLAPFLKDLSQAGGLGHAMKIIINIVYGMTSAKYDNKFRDPRNVDNIVAKRGALFMMMLKRELQAMGQQVIHVKTDSFKLPGANEKIYEYCQKRAHEFGYNFDHEATFSRLALVNKAVIIGEFAYPEYKAGEWEPTGAQFAFPYVYKKLFSGEDLVEDDFAILKSVKSSILLGDRFIGKNAQFYASKTGEDLFRTGEVDLAKKVQTRVNGQMKKDPDGYINITKISKELNITDEEVGEIMESGFKPKMVETRNSIAGTKGFKWNLWSDYKGKEDIDVKYYEDLVEDAVKNIYSVGDGDIIFKGSKWEGYNNRELV